MRDIGFFVKTPTATTISIQTEFNPLIDFCVKRLQRGIPASCTWWDLHVPEAFRRLANGDLLETLDRNCRCLVRNYWKLFSVESISDTSRWSVHSQLVWWSLILLSCWRFVHARVRGVCDVLEVCMPMWEVVSLNKWVAPRELGVDSG